MFRNTTTVKLIEEKQLQILIMTIIIQTSRITEIQNYIDENSKEPPRIILENLQQNYPLLPPATIWSIVNQRLRKRCAITGGKLRKDFYQTSK